MTEFISGKSWPKLNVALDKMAAISETITSDAGTEIQTNKNTYRDKNHSTFYKTLWALSYINIGKCLHHDSLLVDITAEPLK